MDSSSTESESMTEYELNESLPPVVIDADEEEIMSAPPNTMNIPNPKMKDLVKLDAVPLRVVPYGGKEPLPFDKEKLGQYVPVQAMSIHARKTEEDIPDALLVNTAYKEGDWKAFLDRGVDGSRKDWTFEHREYVRKFRSQVEVEEFLNTNGPITGMFRGHNLHKKIDDVDGNGCTGTSKSTRGRKAAKNARGKVAIAAGLHLHGCTGTSKSTRGRKAAKNARGKVAVAAGPPIRHNLPHGFV